MKKKPIKHTGALKWIHRSYIIHKHTKPYPKTIAKVKTWQIKSEVRPGALETPFAQVATFATSEIYKYLADALFCHYPK